MRPGNFIDTALLICRGKPDEILAAVGQGRLWLGTQIFLIVVGSGVYGATIGLWRSPMQAVFTGIKFPLVVLLTTLVNALINSMIAQLLGNGITFRQSSAAILTSFALMSVILVSFSPVTLFIWFNTPPLSSGDSYISHSFMLLAHISVIGMAGIISNVQLLRMLKVLCSEPGAAIRILGSWLAMNLFLGCQLSWILRPFVGSPGLPVQFLRSNAFEGNFYEIAFQSLKNLVT